MFKQTSFYVYVFYVIFTSKSFFVSSGDAPADSLATNRYGAPIASQSAHHIDKAPPQNHPQHYAKDQHGNVGGSNLPNPSNYHAPPTIGSGGHIEKRNSYNLLSEAMSQAVSNEFSSVGSGSADGACHAEDMECYTNNVQDRLGMEAIRTLHQQLDDDDNGNIDLSESDDFLREELKYDSGYEKRQKAFHFNDDMHISVKELWEAWLRSEVHNWTIEQTTDWLAQSVQLPQYVELFKHHKVTGAALPRLAVNNMHYVGNVLGIKDPIHKQKIALKAMDVVLFGPPRETGTRWKDYILVTLLLSAIIGCWYAYQQNKNAKRHLRRMAQDMEGLQRAEQSLQEMQKELERARLEQESVETEKMDLERRLKEAPLLTSSNSDLEVQQLKKEIEMLRSELSRAEIELVDNCWTPPPQLQSWLQYTYELESKNHLKKRISAEKQLQSAREACEKLRKKRSSLVGAFVSTHGKSIDDVDRSIVEARNSLGEVTNELQERLHRWKQIESCLGFNIANNNGLPYLESVLYGRNGGVGSTVSNKSSRGRITNSTDDLDDESVQGIFDSYTRSPASASALMNSASVSSVSNTVNSNYRDDSSSEDGLNDAPPAVQFYLGNAPPSSQTILNAAPPPPPERPIRASQLMVTAQESTSAANNPINAASLGVTIPTSPAMPQTPALLLHNNAQYSNFILNDSQQNVVATPNENRHSHSPSVSSESSVAVPPRNKKLNLSNEVSAIQSGAIGRAPLPPPRKAYQSQMLRSQSTDLVPMEVQAYFTNRSPQSIQHQQQQFCTGIGNPNATIATTSGNPSKKMVKQHSTASQQSSSSTSSSVQSAPPAVIAAIDSGGELCDRWLSPERANFYGYGDKEQQLQPTTVQQSNKHANTTAFVQQLPTSFSLQQFCNNSQCENFHGMSSNNSSTSKSSSTATSSHGYTELGKCIAAADTVSLSQSSDTVSLDGGTKKRRRRLRFPFGSSSKKSTAARSSDSVNGDNASNASKSKLT